MGGEPPTPMGIWMFFWAEASVLGTGGLTRLCGTSRPAVRTRLFVLLFIFVRHELCFMAYFTM